MLYERLLFACDRHDVRMEFCYTENAADNAHVIFMTSLERVFSARRSPLTISHVAHAV